MSNHSREKVALVVFVALIIISFCGLIGYLAIGHSWNVAATSIDDAAGQMNGYTAIVYKGTVEPEEDPAVKPSVTAPLVDTPVVSPLSGSQPAQKSSSEAAVDEAAKTGVTRDAASEGVGSAGTDSGVSDSTVAENGKTPQEVAADGTTAKKTLPTPELVKESYIEKNATVFNLDTDDLDRYHEGTILMKDGHRFGVFSVTSLTTKKMIEREVKYFRDHAVDFIVALTPSKKIVEEAEGIDIVISTKDEGLFVMGETIQGTFYVNAPVVGAVGVILISPSNVVSAKVVQEL